VEDASNIKIPDLNNLKDVFEEIKNATYNGVNGVMCFDSGVEGSTLGVTLCTHGNEPVGLATLWHFIRNKQHKNLQKGRILFVLNNIKATENYFSAKTEDEKYNTRFVDINMNRLPQALEASLSEKYEIKRAQELMPIWEEFSVGIDLHSTSVGSDPMMLLRHGSGVDLVKGFPVQNIISGVANVMQGCTAMDFYGTKENRAHTVLLEAGCHEEPHAFYTAIQCVEALLGNMDIIAEKSDVVIEEYNHYKVCDSVMFPDDSYVTSKIFSTFGTITEGDCLAVGDGDDIVAKVDGHALMCFVTGKPPSLDEEALFISLPVEKVVFDADSCLKKHAS
jgi:succinylglutamate desuccinylase